MLDDKKAFYTQLLDKYGVPVALLCYFLVKDWHFTEQLTQLMTKVDGLLTSIQPLIAK